MLTIIIFLLIGFLVGSIVYEESYSDGAWLWSVIICVVIGIFIASKFGMAPKHTITDERYDLVTLRDNVGTSGRFFLGSGSIESKMYYFFYIREGAGYINKNVEADGVVIFEDEKEKPYYIKTSEHWNDSWREVFGIDGKSGSIKKEFHIPEGSLLMNYQLDSQ